MPGGSIDPLLRKELEDLTAGICKALNDRKRLVLLYALRKGPHTVSELCEGIQAPQSNTSQHLAVLRGRGLVEAQRQGNTVVYSLRHPKVIDAIDLLRLTGQPAHTAFAASASSPRSGNQSMSGMLSAGRLPLPGGVVFVHDPAQLGGRKRNRHHGCHLRHPSLWRWSVPSGLRGYMALGGLAAACVRGTG